MLSAQEVGSALGAVFALGGYIPYIRGILSGKTKPSKVTWILWVALDLLTLAGMIASHSINGQIVAAIAGGIFVTYMAVKRGHNEWTYREKGYLVGGAMGILLWFITRDPRAAIAISLLVVFFAAFPTYELAWKRPQDENLRAWMCGAFAGIPVLVTLPEWTPGNAAQPFSWTIINGITVLILIYRLYIRPPQATSLTS